jgi:serine O-acetyltransferase
VTGKNCNISERVVIGGGARAAGRGSPVIGDNVTFGTGAKVIGPVRVGDRVAVGANCVVTEDEPDRSATAGVPGHVISQAGSDDFVAFTDC